MSTLGCFCPTRESTGPGVPSQCDTVSAWVGVVGWSAATTLNFLIWSFGSLWSMGVLQPHPRVLRFSQWFLSMDNCCLVFLFRGNEVKNDLCLHWRLDDVSLPLMVTVRLATGVRYCYLIHLLQTSPATLCLISLSSINGCCLFYYIIMNE